LMLFSCDVTYAYLYVLNLPDLGPIISGLSWIEMSPECVNQMHHSAAYASAVGGTCTNRWLSGLVRG
jgi:hypothetical protein